MTPNVVRRLSKELDSGMPEQSDGNSSFRDDAEHSEAAIQRVFKGFGKSGSNNLDRYSLL